MTTYYTHGGRHWEDMVRTGRFEAIPRPLRWGEASGLACILDPYAALGSFDTIAALADARWQEAQATGQWPGNALELWACLYVEHRRRMEYGAAITPEAEALLNALCETLRQQLVALNATTRAALMPFLSRDPFAVPHASCSSD